MFDVRLVVRFVFVTIKMLKLTIPSIQYSTLNYCIEVTVKVKPIRECALNRSEHENSKFRRKKKKLVLDSCAHVYANSVPN